MTSKYILNPKGGLEKGKRGLKQGQTQLSKEKTLFEKGGLKNIHKQIDEIQTDIVLRSDVDVENNNNNNKLPYTPVPGYGFHRNDIKKKMIQLVSDNNIKIDVNSHKNVRKQAINELTKELNKIYGYE